MATTHKTMRGSKINMDQLRLQNEKTIAIGNMNVNAAGDELGPGGKIIKTSSQRIKEQNALHTMVPDDLPVQTGAESLSKETVQKEVADVKVKADASDRIEAEKILDEAEAPIATKRTTKPKGGLAATLASEKEVKQEATDPTLSAKKKKGVKRI